MQQYLGVLIVLTYAAMISSLISKTSSLNLRICRNMHKLKSTASSTDVGGYNHNEYDIKWQEYWDKNQVFLTRRRSPDHPKKYVLDMFPYPSGSGLHVGHPEGYTATDIMARYWRMKDYDVLHPMGWDSFGLPAEQHAINTGTHPAVTTYQNIATFKRQLKSLGFSYDWTRELATTDDNYVRWTQWIFLQLFKKGLASQSEVSVNWCPALGTVLANEEVINGLSERGNHPVIRTPLRQWVLKITQYADQLEEGLKDMNWPEGTLTAQKQWIGKSEGCLIKFAIPDSSSMIEVFTTRPDTVMGVTYVVLAPEHSLVNALTTPGQQAAVAAYVRTTASKSDLERTAVGQDKGKSGVFTGSFAIHPLTKQLVQIWIADYVLAGYGTGAVMAVPAHDDRDFVFAIKFNLDIKQVVKPSNDVDVQLPYCDDGVVVHSFEFDGLDSATARQAVTEKLQELSLGSKKISYKLRDWIFSRQRYWGEPIPIYFPVEFEDEKDSTNNPITGSKHRICYEHPIAVEDHELPLKLPAMTNFQPGDDPQGCLARAVEWRYFQREGKWFARETNTMPQWAGSCWYYLRFTDPQCTTAVTSEEGSSWLPVDLYVGGQEHAVLHLLYARFWHKVLYDIGVVNHNEPFKRLVHQGMILGSDNEKMSKSRGNVINPDDVVKEYGADVLRLYEMFMGPLEATKPWQTNQMVGMVRFRDRVVNLVDNYVSSYSTTGLILGNEVLREMHKTIKKVTECIDNLAFNTAISALMVYTNSLTSYVGNIPGSEATSDANESVSAKKALETLVLLISPFAPHVGEELWSRLGNKQTLAYEPWPVFDEKLCEDIVVTIALQVNGKVRGTVNIDKNIQQDEIVKIASDMPSMKKYIDSKPIKKIVYVPGRILNILV